MHKQPIPQFVKDVIMGCDGFDRWSTPAMRREKDSKETIRKICADNRAVEREYDCYIQSIAFNGTITHTNTAYITDKIIAIYNVITFSMAGQHAYAIQLFFLFILHLILASALSLLLILVEH